MALGKIAQEKAAVEKAAGDKAREALEAAAEKKAGEAAAVAAEAAVAEAKEMPPVVRFDSQPEVAEPTPEPEPEPEMQPVQNENSVASTISEDDPLKARLRKLEEGGGVDVEEVSQHSVISGGSTAESWAAQSLDGIEVRFHSRSGRFSCHFSHFWRSFWLKNGGFRTPLTRRSSQ